MCHFHQDLSKEPSVTMDLSLFRRIAAEAFPFTNVLYISCSAEPLLVKTLSDYLMLTKQYKIPYTTLVTNATLLDESAIESFFKSNLSHVEISIDGATKETYQKIRKNADFDKVIHNVKMLCDMKKSRKRKKPTVQLDFTLMKSNFEEFPAFIELGHDIGVDQIRGTHFIPFKSLQLANESLNLYREEANQMLNRAREVSKKLSMHVIMPPNFDKKPPQVKTFNNPNCKFPFFSMCIASDGRVLPCTWFSLSDYYAGDFKVNSFKEIWNSPVYMKLREDFTHQRYTEYCLDCPPWGDDDIKQYTFSERNRKGVTNICSRPI